MRTPAEFMARALELARRGEGWCSPNPMVGAVLVREGRGGPRVIGEGWHRRHGGPHAEIEALHAAKGPVKGAHLYINLEPCSHHGRTPPCADALIAAGIGRVTAAMTDPNPKVAGEGFAKLRRAGIRVEVGLMEAEARLLNERFIHWISTNRPYVLVKLAQTLDGRIADAQGRSRWITGEAARERVHRWRHDHDAVLVGVGTVLADDPSLDCRLDAGGPWRQPVRVIVDPRLRTPPDAKIIRTAKAQRILILASTEARARQRKLLERRGAEIISLKPLGSGLLSWPAMLKAMASQNIASVMVEGGAITAGHLLASGHWQRLAVFVAPNLLVGAGAQSSLAGPDLPLARAIHVGSFSWERVGEDWLATGCPD